MDTSLHHLVALFYFIHSDKTPERVKDDFQKVLQLEARVFPLASQFGPALDLLHDVQDERQGVGLGITCSQGFGKDLGRQLHK